MKNVLIACTFLSVLSLGAVAGPESKVAVGVAAPEFKIVDASGVVIDLAELTKKGPVLVRLTCGCQGCDLELPYFQALHEAYKEQGLTSVAVFAEADEKFAAYAKSKKLNMLYALDPKRESWKVFGTQTMPSNFLIKKGGEIAAISKGCNPQGLKAIALGSQAAKLVSADEVDLAKKAAPRPEAEQDQKKE